MEKLKASSILRNNMYFIKNIRLKDSKWTNVYEFEMDEKEYMLFHRHKNEKGSLMVKLNDLDDLEKKAGTKIAVLGFTICFTNTNTKKEEMLIIVSTVQNLKQQLINPYNTAIIRGEKTNNILLKFDSRSLSILELENDILMVRFTYIPENLLES